MTNEILIKIKDYLNMKKIQEQTRIQDVQNVIFLAQGEYNRNFVFTDGTGNKFIFRINFGSQINQDQQARYEFNALKILMPSHRTPKPIFLDDTKDFFDHDILIEAFLPGIPLIYETDLSTAADIFGDIHRLSLTNEQIDKLIVETNICSDRIKESQQLLSSVFASDKVDPVGKSILDRLLNWCEIHRDDEYFAQQPQNIVNTEVNSNNFLITDDYGYLIDWEKPVYSNSTQDLTQFLAKTTTLWRTETVLNNEDIVDFLKRYSKNVHRSFAEVHESVMNYMPFLLLRALSWCAMLVTTYENKPIKNEEIYRRSKMYLTPGFAMPLLKDYGVKIDV